MSRFLGVLDQEWKFHVEYAGSTPNFQAYLMIIEAPKDLVVAQPNHFMEYSDCVTAFYDCSDDN